MLHLLKNPIVFGAIVGIVLCILLFVHDKFLVSKPEEKSKVLTYVKIFFAGFVATTPLVFLFYNRNLSFSAPGSVAKSVEKVSKEVAKEVIQEGGSEIAEVVNNIVADVSSGSEAAVESAKNISDVIKPKKIKIPKPSGIDVPRCHADVPDW